MNAEHVASCIVSFCCHAFSQARVLVMMPITLAGKREYISLNANLPCSSLSCYGFEHMGVLAFMSMAEPG